MPSPQLLALVSLSLVVAKLSQVITFMTDINKQQEGLRVYFFEELMFEWKYSNCGSMGRSDGDAIVG